MLHCFAHYKADVWLGSCEHAFGFNVHADIKTGRSLSCLYLALHELESVETLL